MKITKKNSSGGYSQLLFTGMRPGKLDVFEDFLYVVLNQEHSVAKLNKFGAENFTMLEAGMMRISDLSIFQENKQIAHGKYCSTMCFNESGARFKSDYVVSELNISTKVPTINNSICFTAFGGQKRNCVCGDGFVELRSAMGSEVNFIIFFQCCTI